MAAERTIGQLVVEATRDISDLVRYEVALAKAEVKGEVQRAAVAGGLFGAAAFLGVLGFLLLLFAAVYVLVALGLPTWAGFLVVAVVLFLIAGVLALVGRSRARKVGTPERTVTTVQGTVGAIKGTAPQASSARPAVPSSGSRRT